MNRAGFALSLVAPLLPQGQIRSTRESFVYYCNLLLQFAKISFPICSFYFLDKLDEIIYDIGSYNIYLGWSVYVIIGIGIVIGAVEIIDIISTEKKKRTAVSK